MSLVGPSNRNARVLTEPFVTRLGTGLGPIPEPLHNREVGRLSQPPAGRAAVEAEKPHVQPREVEEVPTGVRTDVPVWQVPTRVMNPRIPESLGAPRNHPWNSAPRKPDCERRYSLGSGKSD